MPGHLVLLQAQEPNEVPQRPNVNERELARLVRRLHRAAASEGHSSVRTFLGWCGPGRHLHDDADVGDLG